MRSSFSIGRSGTALAFLVTLFTLALTARAAGTLPAAGEYRVVQEGSAVTFNVTNFAVVSVDGRFDTFSGKVTVGGTLATSKIEATIDVRSIDTSNVSRDNHLRTGDYFDVAKYPSMTFKSSQLWGTPENFGMKGALTIKGITKEVTFSGRIEDSGAIRVETKIDRTAFGITSGPTIKNEVRLKLLIKLANAGS